MVAFWRIRCYAEVFGGYQGFLGNVRMIYLMPGISIYDYQLMICYKTRLGGHMGKKI